MAVYVMGDLHGQVEAFERMLRKINFKPSEDKIYLVGDFTDGWFSDGPELILRLDELKKRGCLSAVLGNHDDMMLYTIEQLKLGVPVERLSGFKFDCWMYNGGDDSISRFLNRTPEEKETIYQFLRDLPLFIRVNVAGKNYYIAHAEAYFPNNTGNPDEIERDIQYTLWGNTNNKSISLLGERLMALEPKTTLITGHRITNHYRDYPFDKSDGHSRIVKVPQKRRILMDCGCKGIQVYKQYALGCLRLDDWVEFYITHDDVKNHITSI